MAAIFRLYRLRFHFVSKDRVHYPPGKATNVIRGVLGTLLRGLACQPSCDGARNCELRAGCAYARIFEPSLPNGDGPSGLQDPPRPFVLRASHLDGVTVQPESPFSFDLHLFLTENPPFEPLIQAFSLLADTGLGPSRGRVRLNAVDLIGKDPQADLIAKIFAQGQVLSPSLPLPLEFPLEADSAPVCREVRVRFVTPFEVKHNGRIANRPEFGFLIARIAERLTNLAAVYGSEPLRWDWQGLTSRAKPIKLVDWHVERILSTSRFSTRTGQQHGVGGILGEATYQGEDLAEFLPLLEAATYCGVGRHTVWGNGVLETTTVI